MRWLRWSLFTFIVLLVPIWLLLLIPRINGFSPDTLKQELKHQRAYDQLSAVLHQVGSQPEGEGAEVTDQAVLVLRSALTADYIEAKSGLLIDDTATWLTDQSKPQPILDLNDIKTQVLTAYPDAQIQLDELQQGLAAAQEDLKTNPMPVDGVEGLESDGSASQAEIAKLLQQADSLNNFVAGDFRINLGSTLEPLRVLYQYYQLVLPILAALIAMLSVGFIFTQRGWLVRVKSLGWLLLIAGIVNGILSIVFWAAILEVGLDRVIDLVPSQAEAAGSIGRAVIQALFANYLQLELYISAGLLVAGLLLIVGTVIMSKRANTKAADESSKVKHPSASAPIIEQPASATSIISQKS